MPHQHQGDRYNRWLPGSLIVLLWATPPLYAQITPDGTLPRASRVVREGNTHIITGGTQAGSNLFHSFRDFSIPRGEVASFQQLDASISALITRVTGDFPSTLNGRLEALLQDGTVSPATVFLINPNGIIFGSDASLNIGGSFIASTAEQINFADGSSFRAINPDPAPLLTVSIPVGLQFGEQPGAIAHRSVANLGLDAFGDPITGGLQVAPGRTLALVGGSLTIAGGFSTALEGRIELGSVAEPGIVRLTAVGQGWRLGYGAIQQFASMTLSEGATLNVSGSRSGTIHLRGDRLTLEDAFLFSLTEGEQAGGDILLQASQLEMDNALILSETQGTGRAGNIRVDTRQLNLRQGGQILSLTLGSGDTGTVRITASEAIAVVGGAIDRGWFPSGILTQVGEGASGDGGDVAIATRTLQILAGGQVATTTFGLGDAGSLQVEASAITIAGGALNPDGSLFKVNGFPYLSGLFAGTEQNSSGNGGQLTITTSEVSLRDGGLLQTSTLGEGDAGDLTLQVLSSIEVVGMDQEGLFPTSLVAVSGGIPGITAVGVPEATGLGGTVRIQTGSLVVRDGGAIAVGSLNPSGEARGSGNLTVQAQTLELSNQGRILAETASGDGGNLEFQITDVLLLRQGSQISTTAGLARQGGNGGNIQMNAEAILSVLSENNDITANAFTGNGGNVQITTQTLLGIEPQAQLTPQSDITASSEFGTSGEIIINTPDTDPTRGLTQLPTDLVDASQLIAEGCAPGTTVARFEEDQFVVTGRGGVPQAPTDALSSSLVLTDWAVLDSEDDAEDQTKAEMTDPLLPSLPDSPALIEAQGWAIAPTGEIHLIAPIPPPLLSMQPRQSTCQ